MSVGPPRSCATLADLPVGSRARVARIDLAGPTAPRLLEMGLTEGTEVAVVRFAPLGDPIEIRVRGYLLTLRRSDARAVVLAGDSP